MMHPKDRQCTDIENADICVCDSAICVCEFLEAHIDAKCQVGCPICENERLKAEYMEDTT